jgi:hypothetical protein
LQVASVLRPQARKWPALHLPPFNVQLLRAIHPLLMRRSLPPRFKVLNKVASLKDVGDKIVRLMRENRPKKKNR